MNAHDHTEYATRAPETLPTTRFDCRNDWRKGLEGFAALPDVKDISSRDTVLPVVPMFHANAWGLIYTGALIGAELVLPGPKLDAESVLDLLADERVTITAGVPTVWMAVLQAIEAEPDRWDLSATSSSHRKGGWQEVVRSR